MLVAVVVLTCAASMPLNSLELLATVVVPVPAALAKPMVLPVMVKLPGSVAVFTTIPL